MITINAIKQNLLQIQAMVEKTLKMQLRFKATVIIGFFTPIISVIMPIIIMGRFFELNEDFGPWNQNTYTVFILIAYNLTLLRSIIAQYPGQLRQEKYWETLPGLIIAPFNRFNLLIGIFFSHIILISVPFLICTVLCYYFYPVSIVTVLFIIFLYFLIAVLFSGVGLILGIFAVSKENLVAISNFLITVAFWFSCLSFPYELYPEPIQAVMNLNPLYYILYFIRIAWIENNIIYSIITHFYYFLMLIIAAGIFPGIGVIVFNKIYRKYGIVGY